MESNKILLEIKMFRRLCELERVDLREVNSISVTLLLKIVPIVRKSPLMVVKGILSYLGLHSLEASIKLPKFIEIVRTIYWDDFKLKKLTNFLYQWDSESI